jgi:aminopeptidase N
MQARWKRRLAAAGASATAIGLAVSGSAVAAPAPGAAGIGDAYYPEYGNGGYDVDHYGISIGYTPSTGRLTGRTTITAKATQDLSRFNLDFALTASAVTVNGAPATISTRSRELIVTPAAPVVKDSTMTVVVTYAGIPTTVAGSPWVKTPDGAVALGEPEISAWWFPGNDHPRDKATYDVTMTVPTGIEALSNGTLTSHTSPVGKEVWAWRESKPMATYLAFMAIGQYDVARSTTAAGLPVVTAVASNGGAAGAAAKVDLARTAEVVDWHAGRWGPYAFDATGGVAPNADFGFALENQTRPVYSRLFWTSGSNIYVVVHEQAHQWFGDSVSVDQWKDIWLNEGFATYTEWVWSSTHGQGTTTQAFAQAYSRPASSSFWTVKIGDPGVGNEFNGAVYDRGAMTLQALRTRVGATAFYQIMRTWAQTRKYGNGNIAQFTALAQQVSGQDLGAFFTAWLYTGSKPAATAGNGVPTAAALRSLPVPASQAKREAVQAQLIAQARGAAR